VRDRESLPVAGVPEGRRAGTFAVVEHGPAPGRGVWWQVYRNEPDAGEIGHDQTPTARRNVAPFPVPVFQ
jgi:hypothetical protein